MTYTALIVTPKVQLITKVIPWVEIICNILDEVDIPANLLIDFNSSGSIFQR